MSSTQVSQHVKAPRARVYRALIDANAIARWKVPTGMSSQVHVFEGHEGGQFRISLTYEAPTAIGQANDARYQLRSEATLAACRC